MHHTGSLLLFLKGLLATFKSSCTISYAEGFARLARVLEAVIRKCEIRK